VSAFKPSSPQAPPALTLPQAKEQARRIEQPNARPTKNSRVAGTFVAPMPSSPVLEVQAGTIAVATPATPALQLDLRRAALDAERGRDQASVASAVNAQHGRSPQSSRTSAFSPLSAVPSGMVAETTVAGDARGLQFSGGGCMVFPNAAARAYEDVRKPMMTNC